MSGHWVTSVSQTLCWIAATRRAALTGSWLGASRWQLRDFAGWMCAAAPCTMTGVSTGSRLQDHDLAE